MKLSDLDVELRLLLGKEIFLNGLPIHSVSLSDSFDFGYRDYQHIISILCLTKEDLEGNLHIDDCTPFMFLYQSCILALSKLQSKEFASDELMLASLTFKLFELIFHEEINIDAENPAFIIGDKGRLSEENYNRFQMILRKRNCLDDSDLEESDNPDSEMTRRLLEKRRQLREKVKQAKSKHQDDDDPLTIADLVSIFAEEEHMFLQDVCEKYDIYQFNNQFNRMTIMADYHVSIQALMAGAKKEDIKLKHWLSKPNKKGGN